MTGSLAEHGQNLRRAAEFAVEKANAAGGVEVGGQKYTIKLVFGDDEGLVAERAVAATQRLIEQEMVLGMIGWAISSQLLAAMPIIQQAGVPTINTLPAESNQRRLGQVPRPGARPLHPAEEARLRDDQLGRFARL
jgi:branched-chain amino acid transport system substrate-binding protein